VLKRLAIAFFFDEAGIVDDYMLHLVKEIGKFAERTIFVVNGPLHVNSELVVRELVDELLVRENTDFDVGGYKAALEKIGFNSLQQYDEIILYNHTFFGPIFPFDEMFEAMEKSDCDFWGISDHREVRPEPTTKAESRSRETRIEQRLGDQQDRRMDQAVDRREAQSAPGAAGVGDFQPVRRSDSTASNAQSGNGRSVMPRHIQSHFIAVRGRMLRSDSFRLYWQTMPDIKNYDDAIKVHETRFTEHFSDLGFKWKVYVDSDKYGSDYPTFVEIDETVANRSPILKRRPFFHDPLFLDQHAIDLARALRVVRDETSYDLGLIWRNICRTAEPRILNTNAVLTSIFPDFRIKQSTGPPSVGNLAVCAHLFHADMVTEMLRWAHNIPLRFDFIVTTDTQLKKSQIEKVLAQSEKINNAVVRVVKNRGRDMSALFINCRDFFLDDRYALVCRLHTKKSPQDGASSSRGFTRHVVENLLNSEGYVTNVLDMFEDNPWIGVAVPPIVHISYPTLGQAWYTNRPMVEELVRRLKLKVKLDLATPVAPYGGMYWFRPRALRKLFEYEWKLEEFGEEPNSHDGDLGHALERLICYAAQDARYLTQHIMSIHQAERNYSSLEFKLQKLCSLLPARDFSSQCALLQDWMDAGHRVRLPLVPSAPAPQPLPRSGPGSGLDWLTGNLAQSAAVHDRLDETSSQIRNDFAAHVKAQLGKDADLTPRSPMRDMLRRFVRKNANPGAISLADRARDAGQWELAAGYYRDALRRDPNNAPIWVQYGHVLKESGILPEAEWAYRTALALDQSVADSHLQLGHVLKIQSRREEAKAAYLRAFALDSSSEDALSELAQLG